ncbi:hypothetical protein E2C01_011268 [Portunus trituberculatus]|uniref:Uncharacterized protein n=1 Tax=Portunus trituberculatus TaxID=210409 RepID=A0A5B7DAM2_PORTR|nr:hypothetical protein [Portunus trituberculatus]
MVSVRTGVGVGEYCDLHLSGVMSHRTRGGDRSRLLVTVMKPSPPHTTVHLVSRLTHTPEGARPGVGRPSSSLETILHHSLYDSGVGKPFNTPSDETRMAGTGRGGGRTWEVRMGGVGGRGV